MKQLFHLGQLLITRNAMDVLTLIDVANGVSRHMSGDWGDLCKGDKEQNELALAHNNERILSAYHDSKGIKFWIITEADRRSTTVLLPEDY